MVFRKIFSFASQLSPTCSAQLVLIQFCVFFLLCLLSLLRLLGCKRNAWAKDCIRSCISMQLCTGNQVFLQSLRYIGQLKLFIFKDQQCIFANNYDSQVSHRIALQIKIAWYPSRYLGQWDTIYCQSLVFNGRPAMAVLLRRARQITNAFLRKKTSQLAMKAFQRFFSKWNDKLNTIYPVRGILGGSSL